MKNWNHKNKVNSSVLASGMVGAIAAPGVVFCAERALPKQMDWVKRVVADHVVMPHLERFELASAKLMRANEKRCENTAEGCPPDPALQGEDPNSPHGRALAIADGLVTALLAWKVDFVATLAAQHAINKKLGINTSPLKTTFIDSAVSLGAMAVMPTLLAKPSEGINHTLSSIIQKVTGMPKDHAEDLSVPIVYAGIPNLLGTFAALKSAQGFSKGRG